MFPTLVKIGNFEITTFGLMMFLAFVIGGWVMAKQFKHYRLDPEHASSLVLYAALGGIIGAKVYYAILFRDWHLLFERAGLVWYGGMIGGFLACSWYVLRHKLDYLTVADATAPAAAIGYALGRVGCFLVGDDYGRPTDAWYGIAFPQGAPPTTAGILRREFGVQIDPSIPDYQVMRVHPTQLYEVGAALIMFAILMYVNRRPHRRGLAWGLFLVMLGIERFLVEMVRAKDDRFLGPFTIAQLISVVLVIAGTYWATRKGRIIEPVA